MSPSKNLLSLSARLILLSGCMMTGCLTEPEFQISDQPPPPQGDGVTTQPPTQDGTPLPPLDNQPLANQGTPLTPSGQQGTPTEPPTQEGPLTKPPLGNEVTTEPPLGDGAPIEPNPQEGNPPTQAGTSTAPPLGDGAPIEPNPQQEGNPPTEDGSSADPPLGDGAPTDSNPQQEGTPTEPPGDQVPLNPTQNQPLAEVDAAPQEQDNVGPLDPIKENITPLAAGDALPPLDDKTPENPPSEDANGEGTPAIEGSEEFVPYLDLENSEGSCTPIRSQQTYALKKDAPVVEVFSSTKLVDVGGALLVEIVQNHPQKGSIVLINFNCERAAKISYSIPTKMGTVYAVYFIDQNGDGPSEGDIRGISPAIDTTEPKREEFTIRLAKGSSIDPLQLPFIPVNLGR